MLRKHQKNRVKGWIRSDFEFESFWLTGRGSFSVLINGTTCNAREPQRIFFSWLTCHVVSTLRSKKRLNRKYFHFHCYSKRKWNKRLFVYFFLPLDLRTFRFSRSSWVNYYDKWETSLHGDFYLRDNPIDRLRNWK